MKHILLDTNVFFSVGLRSLMLHLFEQSSTYYPHWSDHIIGEWKATQRSRFGKSKFTNPQVLSPEQEMLWPNALIDLKESIKTPELLWDTADTKVVQSAIAANCTLILTYNVKDFPNSKLRPFGVRAIHPEKLLIEMLEDKKTMLYLGQFADQKHKGKMEALITYLKKIALNNFAASIQRRL